jgi:uncharacterized protein VirK/YbjX
LDLSDVRAGLRLVVDQPKWFMREGGLSLNLFVGCTRFYTLAFSFASHGNKIEAFIGAIQGRDLDGAPEEYRVLTKAAHGMRPRDFLIELFRILCRSAGVSTIFAVADQYRHHRHSYFASNKQKQLNNYDEIWRDRGGIQIDDLQFELPLTLPRRDSELIPTKKRAMYRRRYAMLDVAGDRLELRLLQIRKDALHGAQQPAVCSEQRINSVS